MTYAIPVWVHGQTERVDGRDVAAWHGRNQPLDHEDNDAVDIASAYVQQHPRAGSPASAQRLVIYRRLAAGPATQAELLACMRECGWVGASDFENRLREYRASDARSGASARLDLRVHRGRYWFASPFPLLQTEDLRALGFARAMLEQLQGVLPELAVAAVHHLVPGLGMPAQANVEPKYGATVADYARLYAAYAQQRAVKVTYNSYNTQRVGTYNVVPIEYVSMTPSVKALCVEVTSRGERAAREYTFDRQLALDRIVQVEDLPDWEVPREDALVLDRTDLELTVSDSLYRIIVERNLLGVDPSTEYVQDPYDQSWRITGSFPTALSWDVMEQLCAWAGQVQVHKPLWLLNAVLRRLRAGMRAMEEGDAFTLVKPEPMRAFSDERSAVTVDSPLPPRRAPVKLQPPE